MAYRSFGELLRRFRGEAGLTQGGLAAVSGVGAETIRSLESGRRRAPREDTVRSLAAALGVDPAALRPGGAAGAVGAVVPRELPADVRDFTGRADELRRLAAALRGPGLTVISGPAGSGKTALAVHAAHRANFPGGVLFRTTSRPAPASGRALVLYDGVPPADLPDVTVLATSRDPLPGGNAITLGGLPAADAVRLLHRIAGAARWSADPDGTRRVVALCGGMPAALRRAAARLAGRPAWTPADLAGSLAAERRRAARTG